MRTKTSLVDRQKKKKKKKESVEEERCEQVVAVLVYIEKFSLKL